MKIGEVLSPPLRDIIRLYMKPSQNLENDTVLADVGEATRTASTPSWRTSEELGLAALHQFLDANDLPSSEVHFNEGSGLSTDNLTTANAFVALLEFMWRHPAGTGFCQRAAHRRRGRHAAPSDERNGRRRKSPRQNRLVVVDAVAVRLRHFRRRRTSGVQSFVKPLRAAGGSHQPRRIWTTSA